ncbi:DNA-binding helix-turn-helix domain-containing protein [Chromobacterium vaccinii]|nr:DNA-binding helix-turn-helix domain-containing protein [Chromobacterium vaccinii]QND89793.1 DNA-binding helix-turn-helix domain-containing protein [Chromobacterium vaccinii]
MNPLKVFDANSFFLLTELANRYNCARSTIYRYMNKEGFPQPVKFGAQLYFPKDAVLDWERKKFNPSSEPIKACVDTAELPNTPDIADLKIRLISIKAQSAFLKKSAESLSMAADQLLAEIQNTLEAA